MGVGNWGPYDDSTNSPYPYIFISIPQPILENNRNIQILNDSSKRPASIVDDFLDFSTNIERRQEYYEPQIEEMVKAGAAQMNAAVQVPFPPGHPLASKFQYDHWKKSHPGGNYWDFYLDNLRDPYTENCQN